MGILKDTWLASVWMNLLALQLGAPHPTPIQQQFVDVERNQNFAALAGSFLFLWTHQRELKCCLPPAQWWRYPLSSRQCIELRSLLASVKAPPPGLKKHRTDRVNPSSSKMTCFVLVPHHSRLNRTKYIMHGSCEFFAHAIYDY